MKEPIAIVGMACRFPGDATDTNKLWELMMEARSAHSEVPAARFDQNAFYHPESKNNGTVRTMLLSNVFRGFSDACCSSMLKGAIFLPKIYPGSMLHFLISARPKQRWSYCEPPLKSCDADQILRYLGDGPPVADSSGSLLRGL